MKASKNFKNLVPLLSKTSFTAQEAREHGVSSALINYYIESGKLKRLSRGIYQAMSYNYPIDIFKWEDLIDAVHSVPGGTVCLISALDIYDITEQIPRRHWIAVSHNTSIKKRDLIRIVRLRNYDLGRTEININGVCIPIFDKERTIIDAFRLLSRETAIKALQMALKPEDITDCLNLKKLSEYARKLNVNISPYLEMALT